MNWLKKVFSGLAGVLSGKADAEIRAGLEAVQYALPIVRQIAQMTPTRSDDEIIRLFEAYGIPSVDRWLHLPRQDRGRALMHVGALALKRIAPTSPDRIIDFAVQAAVLEVKAK